MSFLPFDGQLAGHDPMHMFGRRGALEAIGSPPATPAAPRPPVPRNRLLSQPEKPQPRARGLADMLGQLAGNPLFNMGLNLLAQDGYSTTPTTFGQQLGRAGMATMESMRDQEDRAQQRQLAQAVLGSRGRQASPEAVSAGGRGVDGAGAGTIAPTQPDEDNDQQMPALYRSQADAEREAIAAGLTPGTEAFRAFVGRRMPGARDASAAEQDAYADLKARYGLE